MPRKRTIDPGIWTDPDFVELTIRQRLLFIGLFSNADDKGRLRGEGRSVKMIIFPADDITAGEIEADLFEIAKRGLIVQYKISDKPYICLPSFLKYQKMNYTSDSNLPPPPSDTEQVMHKLSTPNPQPLNGTPENEQIISIPLTSCPPEGRDSLGTYEVLSGCSVSTEEILPRVEECSVEESSTTSEPTGSDTEKVDEQPTEEKHLKYAEDSREYKAAKWFKELVEPNYTRPCRPNLQKWAHTFHLLFDEDGIKPDLVHKIGEWAARDDFERSNVLSPSKLRERFDQLSLKYKSSRSPKGKGNTPPPANPIPIRQTFTPLPPKEECADTRTISQLLGEAMRNLEEKGFNGTSYPASEDDS